MLTATCIPAIALGVHETTKSLLLGMDPCICDVQDKRFGRRPARFGGVAIGIEKPGIELLFGNPSVAPSAESASVSPALHWKFISLLLF